MGRNKGSTNKEPYVEEFSYTAEQRLKILATLLIEIFVEEEECNQIT